MGKKDHPSVASKVIPLDPRNWQPYESEHPATVLARKLTEAINEYVSAQADLEVDALRHEIDILHAIIEHMEQGEDPSA